MNRTKSKAIRRQAEEWCFESLRASFPEEVVDDMDREELWKLAFPETHYNERFQSQDKYDDDGDPIVFTRMRLFKMSPRHIYKHLKKNPGLTKEEYKEICAN